jgi:hypothetical protein
MAAAGAAAYRAHQRIGGLAENFIAGTTDTGVGCTVECCLSSRSKSRIRYGPLLHRLITARRLKKRRSRRIRMHLLQ